MCKNIKTTSVYVRYRKRKVRMMHGFLQLICMWQSDCFIGRSRVALHQPCLFLFHRVTQRVEEHLKARVLSLDTQRYRPVERKVHSNLCHPNRWCRFSACSEMVVDQSIWRYRRSWVFLVLIILPLTAMERSRSFLSVPVMPMPTYQIEFCSILSHQLLRTLEGVGQTLLSFLKSRRKTNSCIFGHRHSCTIFCRRKNPLSRPF